MASDGLLDTSVFIHAQAHDQHSADCSRFLAALERGDATAYLHPLVWHELSSALPHYLKQMTRQDVATYLLTVLSWPGVIGDKALMVDATERWRDTPGLSLVDAFLAALASNLNAPVYTKNVREIQGQGVDVPLRLSRD